MGACASKKDCKDSLLTETLASQILIADKPVKAAREGSQGLF